MTSTTIHLLTILSVLIAPLSALSPIIRHSGKSHPHPKIRQRPEGNGPVGGLNELVTLPTVPNSSPSSIHIILRDTMLPTPTSIAIMSTATNPPTISFYVFPTTVIQIAVATNCPDTSSSSPIFSILPTDPAPYHATNTTKSTSRIATDYLPVYVNATVLLPNGSSTVFLSLSTSTITATTTIPAMSLKPTETPLAVTARIILDGNGCQTVYTAMTVPICSTTIRLPGMLPEPVTDCDQWVTFSSQKLGDCFSTDDTILASASPSPLRITGPVAFYAAHWYELVQGPVPNIVQVENCLPRATSSLICQTSSEAWSVVYNTEVITTSSVASFSGVCCYTPFSFTAVFMENLSLTPPCIARYPNLFYFHFHYIPLFLHNGHHLCDSHVVKYRTCSHP